MIDVNEIARRIVQDWNFEHTRLVVYASGIPYPKDEKGIQKIEGYVSERMETYVETGQKAIRDPHYRSIFDRIKIITRNQRNVTRNMWPHGDPNYRTHDVEEDVQQFSLASLGHHVLSR